MEDFFSDEDDADLLQAVDLAEKAGKEPPPCTQAQGAPRATRPEPSTGCLQALRRHFGHRTFKPMQWEIITDIMEAKRSVC